MDRANKKKKISIFIVNKCSFFIVPLFKKK